MPPATIPAASAPRRRASEVVHDQLRRQILDGRLRAGDALPSERTLSADLGVNRHAVREAIKRLQQAGLAQVTHGGATRVLDWRAHGGLELLVDLAALAGAGERARFLRAVLEMRATVGADAARLCAERAGDELRRELRRLAERQARGATYDERLEGYERLWERIVEGSGNVAYRLAFNSLVGARHGRGVDARAYAAEVDDAAAAARLAATIAGGRGQQAWRAARALLERSIAAAGAQR